jgi:hypothetical protein
MWAGHVSRMVEVRNACSILVRKPERGGSRKIILE